MSQEYDHEKARNAILYICQKMQNNGDFGNVLLNKALFYIDHTSYVKTGSKITGFSYVKQLRGPTPSPKEYMPLLEEMLDKKELREREIKKFGFTQKKSIAEIDPNLNFFGSDEVALMDEVIQDLMQVTATAVSNASHEHLAWKIAGQMEELPAFTYLLTEDDLDDNDLAWGEAEIVKYENSATAK